MNTSKLLTLGLLAVMVVVIVAVDVTFFKDRFWMRLIANVGIAAIFIAFYLRFFK